MQRILLYSDKENLARELLAAASIIASSIDCEVKAVTINDDAQAEALAAIGADVYRINNDEVQLADVACLASVLKQAADKLGSNMVLLSSNRRGRELAGRLSQMMEAGCLTGVIGLEVNGDRIECQRNTMGGAAVATQYIASEKGVIALMPKAFPSSRGTGAGSINDLEVEAFPTSVKVIETKAKRDDSVNIEDAEVLVAVGQGLSSKDDLAMIETLARVLSGEIACSKPLATDRKWLPEERVIGLSGKKCKPELAILLGVSGQVQFMVGIRDARIIVSVNSDENAYINQMADYVMIADLYEVVPELNAALG